MLSWWWLDVDDDDDDDDDVNKRHCKGMWIQMVQASSARARLVSSSSSLLSSSLLLVEEKEEMVAVFGLAVLVGTRRDTKACCIPDNNRSVKT